ncbi:DUF4352 domain-containing protein [Enterococcus faecalis]|uniref:DUF4352 domain-containing protein n=1 Tax=Enterococcus faecalis TaxID=1351 RepID=UPI0013866609|nr:DUF4352 domain-containing protein [Enterococcus faecalis]MEB7428026.1 DUF4352 domain-containing protein [Enterococcus faecalis]
MKKRIVFFSLVVALTLSACSSNNEKLTEDSDVRASETIKQQRFDTKRANMLEITPKNLKAVTNGSNEENVILTIELLIKNTDSVENGAGAYDFVLKSGGKELSPYSEANNFGDNIAAGKEMTGKVSFEVPKNSKELELVYKVSDKKLASWKLNLQGENTK